MEIYEWETFDWFPATETKKGVSLDGYRAGANHDEESGGLPGG